MHKSSPLTPNYIEENYLSRKKSVSQICEEIGIQPARFYQILRKYNIKPLGKFQPKSLGFEPDMKATHDARDSISEEVLKELYLGQLYSIPEIVEKLNSSYFIIRKLMEVYDIELRPFGKIKDLRNQRFGNLITIRPIHSSEGGNSFRWECKCDCGNTTMVMTGHLVQGHTKSCGCLSNLTGKDSKNWKGCGNIPGLCFTKIQDGARDRDLEYGVSREYLNNLYIQQSGICALTGREIGFTHFGNYRYKGDWNASLDRIDSSIGYTSGNVQWVDIPVNLAKHAANNETFIQLCKDVADYARKKEADSLGR